MIKNLKDKPQYRQVTCPMCGHYAFLTESKSKTEYKGLEIDCNRYSYICHNCREEYTYADCDEINMNILKTEYRNITIDNLLD